MKVFYGWVLFFVGLAFSALGQQKCDARIEHTVVKNPSEVYSITLQSSENLRNVEVELYDLYEGKSVQKKEISNGLRSKQTVFSGVKPSLYLIYIKHDGCPRVQSVGGITGIKVGIIE